MAYTETTLSGYGLDSASVSLVSTLPTRVSVSRLLTGSDQLEVDIGDRDSFRAVVLVVRPPYVWHGSNWQAEIEVNDMVQTFTGNGVATRNTNFDGEFTSSTLTFDVPATNNLRPMILQVAQNRVPITMRLAWDTSETTLRLGNRTIQGIALGNRRLTVGVIGEKLLWSVPPTGSQGYTVPVAGQRAGSSFFEWTGTIPTRFDLGGSLRGILFEQNNTGGRASFYFERPLYATRAIWDWNTELRLAPDDPYDTQQEFTLDLSTRAIATLGTVSGLYRYYADLTDRSQIGSYTATVNNWINVASRAVTGNIPFTSWSAELDWTES